MKSVVWFLVGLTQLMGAVHAMGFEMKGAFVDRCSGKETTVTNPNGTSIKLWFPALSADEPLTIDIEWRVAGPNSELSEKYRIRQQYEYRAGRLEEKKEYFFKIPRDRMLDSIEEKVPGSRIWSVNVLASQSGRVQGVVLYLLRVEKDFDYFVPTGTPFCHWSSGRRVSSQYYYNPGPKPMMIRRVLSAASETGFTREWFPPFFRGRGKEFLLVGMIPIEREWSLEPLQGGVFADRVIFSRMPVDHFEWKKPANGESCGAYVRTESGLLDSPETVSEFYTVPRTLIGDESALLNFLERVSPSLQTCTDIPNAGFDPFDAEFRFTPLQP